MLLGTYKLYELKMLILGTYLYLMILGTHLTKVSQNSSKNTGDYFLKQIKCPQSYLVDSSFKARLLIQTLVCGTFAFKALSFSRLHHHSPCH